MSRPNTTEAWFPFFFLWTTILALVIKETPLSFQTTIVKRRNFSQTS